MIGKSHPMQVAVGILLDQLMDLAGTCSVQRRRLGVIN